MSKYIGDIPAIHATRFLKKVVNTSQKNINNLTGALIEYWQEENPVLAKKRSIEIFNEEVDKIVEDTERLEARMKTIIKKRKL